LLKALATVFEGDARADEAAVKARRSMDVSLLGLFVGFGWGIFVYWPVVLGNMDGELPGAYFL
jgi:hypothetical protein